MPGPGNITLGWGQRRPKQSASQGSSKNPTPTPSPRWEGIQGWPPYSSSPTHTFPPLQLVHTPSLVLGNPRAPGHPLPQSHFPQKAPAQLPPPPATQAPPDSTGPRLTE
ncbi:extensin-like isoform X2 [Dromiciops gliroides]|uniref:extensin-like isoform X2 n=1 Tax=Dromiciops gliroides TaxID=33562 RepID=UPI001CC3F8F0|nr:extensin-like isoform X2 [Dromiciops gliroides]